MKNTTKELLMEELIAKRDSERKLAETKVELYNKLNSSNARNARAVHKAREEAEECAKAHNNVSKLISYKEIEATENPVIALVEKLYFPTISIKEKKQSDDSVVPELIIAEGQKQIDLYDFEKLTSVKFHSEEWQALIRLMNHRFVYASAIDCGANCKFIAEYESMKDVKASIDRGEKPLSRENMTCKLYACVEAVIGTGYSELWNTETGRDTEGNPLTIGNSCVNFIHRTFCKKGKNALQIVCGSPKTFAAILAEVCHLLVTGESVSVESRTIEAEIKKAKKLAEKAAKKAEAEKAKAEKAEAEKAEAENKSEE